MWDWSRHRIYKAFLLFKRKRLITWNHISKYSQEIWKRKFRHQYTYFIEVVNVIKKRNPTKNMNYHFQPSHWQKLKREIKPSVTADGKDDGQHSFLDESWQQPCTCKTHTHNITPSNFTPEKSSHSVASYMWKGTCNIC